MTESVLNILSRCREACTARKRVISIMANPQNKKATCKTKKGVSCVWYISLDADSYIMLFMEKPRERDGICGICTSCSIYVTKYILRLMKRHLWKKQSTKNSSFPFLYVYIYSNARSNTPISANHTYDIHDICTHLLSAQVE